MGQYAVKDLHDREIEVDRKLLIGILERNLQNHIIAYKEALNGYKKVALIKLHADGERAKRELEKRLKRIASDIEEFDPEKPHQFSDNFVLIQQVFMTLSVPKSYVAEYEAAIDIAKWDVNDTMKLTFAEFQCFVRDVWDWTKEFQTTNMSYSSPQ